MPHMPDPNLMLLEDTPQAEAWLQQFNLVDRQIARQLLRRLDLVSQSDFERNLQDLVDKAVVGRISRDNIALLTVSEPPPTSFQQDHVRRVAGSSSDRIKHVIENLSRVHGGRVSANPTVESMRQERVRNIVLVEDFIGTGNRIANFWRERAPKSIKSWVSYGWTKLWVAAYEALPDGRAAMLQTLPIDEGRIVTVVPPRHVRMGLTQPMVEVARKYGERLVGRNWGGYGGGRALTVFQHGCPNNAPAILWCAKGKFRPLFPDRGVPVELQQCFGQRNALAVAEDLWTFGQYRLALALSDCQRTRGKSHSQLQLTIALGLASAYGKWEDHRLQVQMRIPAEAVSALRVCAYRLDLIDKSDHRLTAFGRTLLDRMREVPVARPRYHSSPAKVLPQLTDLYYPDSSGGVARH